MDFSLDFDFQLWYNTGMKNLIQKIKYWLKEYSNERKFRKYWKAEILFYIKNQKNNYLISRKDND